MTMTPHEDDRDTGLDDGHGPGPLRLTGVDDLMAFLDASPSPWHAAESAAESHFSAINRAADLACASLINEPTDCGRMTDRSNLINDANASQGA